MPRASVRRLAAASAVLAVAVSLAACASSPSPGASASTDIAGTTITVYNAQHEELTQAWADAFTKQTGVASNPALPPLDTLEPPTIDPSTLNSSQVSDLMTAAGLI